MHTVFTLVSPTIRGHLLLLARLSAALFDAGFKAAVLRRAGRDEILAEARRVEAALAHKHEAQGPAAPSRGGSDAE